MSEQKQTQVSKTVCPFAVDCYMHFESTTQSAGREGREGEKHSYKFRVHFKSLAEIHQHAVESMQRVVAYRARTDEKFPQRDSIIDIDHKGNFVETLEDYLEALDEMSPEQQLKAAEKAKAVLAKLAAVTKS